MKSKVQLIEEVFGCFIMMRPFLQPLMGGAESEE